MDMDKENIEQKSDSEPAKKETAEKKEAKTLKKELEKLKAELDEAKGQNELCQDKLLRVMAEYDNYRKRVTREREQLFADACSDVISAYLPMYDNLLRASQYADGEKLSEGVVKIISQFREINSKLGAEEFGEAGEVFDPNLHEAVMHIEDSAFSENTIAEVFQKGYRIGEKIIRYAVVKVAN